VVTCAEVCLLKIMCSAIFWRMMLIGSTRIAGGAPGMTGGAPAIGAGDGAGGATSRGGADTDICAGGGCGAGAETGRCGAAGVMAVWAGAVDGGAACGLACPARYASRSCLVIRPPTPVPFTRFRSILFSRAILRTNGESGPGPCSSAISPAGAAAGYSSWAAPSDCEAGGGGADGGAEGAACGAA
jgi:hypothetical protein